jgi:DNA adenine methylase Dam
MLSTCPFNYSGSKSGYVNLFSIEEPLLDLFSGGGGFWSNSKSGDVIANDINVDIINLQKLIYNMSYTELLEFIDKVSNITNRVESKDDYNNLRNNFNSSKDPVLFYSVLACCMNNMIRYNSSGKFNQTWGKRKFSNSLKNKLIDFYNRIKVKQVEFTSNSFDVILQSPLCNNRLIFVDPPYLISAAAYNSSWNEQREKTLYELLRGKKFLLTNYLQKGDLYNEHLKDFIKDYPYLQIRSGEMKSQKTQEQFVEILVASDSSILDKYESNFAKLDKFFI